MSTDTSNPSETPERPEDEVADERTPVALSYRGASQVVSDEGGSRLALYANRERDPVRLKGTIKAPLLVREALSCLYDVVSSDFRYVPKDRSAYLAYQRMKKSAAGLSAWQAQQAYYEWMARNDPLAFLILDPVVTVHPDALLFEVFSKDEGTYAQLAIDRGAIDVDGDVTCGTTNIDYSKGLFDGVQRMRSYRETRIDIGDEQVEVATATGGGEASAIEKQINVPDTWLRGFLQVQSAATLPTTVVKIAAIDLYNVLRKLRLNKDQKKKGRGIRVELVPGEAPRLVLEPWEEVITTDAGKFAGKTPAMIRIWGRRRLMLLRRLLPFAEEIELHLLGSGLPSFYVIRAGAVRLTLGLSGFTSANWAQAVAFDLLLPRAAADKTQGVLADILGHLEEARAMTSKALAKASGHKEKEVLRALQLGCQHGQVMFDLAAGVYRHRPLLGAAIDASRLEYRNLRERVAHDLIAAKAAKITQESQVYGSGLEITGEVKVKADRREYRPKMTIADDGRVRKAECTCSFFRKHKLKEGPCAHLIALRLVHAIEEQRKKSERGGARTKVVVETRTYARRRGEDEREEVVQLALDRQRIKVRWGERGAKQRVQSLVFNSVAEARAAFFARADELEAGGYLDEAAV